jgi:hypothetical protein
MCGFAYCSALTRIYLPELTLIGNFGFCKCTKLIEVNLPKLTNLQNFAFERCANLQKLNLPELLVVGKSVFKGCKSIKTVCSSVEFNCTDKCGVCPVCTGQIDNCLENGKVLKRIKEVQKMNTKLQKESFELNLQENNTKLRINTIENIF